MNRLLFVACIFFAHQLLSLDEIDKICRQEIYFQYRDFKKLEPLLNPFSAHMQRLRVIVRECQSVMEFGRIGKATTLSIFLGLTDGELKNTQYCGVSRHAVDFHQLKRWNRWARGLNIEFSFLNKNTCLIEPQSFDLLFIDSDHRYAHLSLELENMHSKIGKYIFLHHTGSPWGYRDEQNYFIDDFVYPDWIEKTKKGLQAAVDDFLNRHPEWQKYEENANSHGFTILKRIK
ncbi:MAG: class I SAM-dependent methyltransferase [Chlamydiae bacterium]|nr:class I SAM-dependent methyltransferase [Chlamydiota bacterium]